MPTESSTGLVRTWRPAAPPVAPRLKTQFLGGKLILPLCACAPFTVNGYLREAVLARSGPDPGGADYEPHPLAPAETPPQAPCDPATDTPAASPGGGEPSTAAAAAAEPPPPAPELPLALWEQILRSAALSPADLRSAGQVCRVLRAAADADATWERQFRERWGRVPGAPGEGVTWCAGGGETARVGASFASAFCVRLTSSMRLLDGPMPEMPRARFFAARRKGAFRARLELMAAMRCPVCSAPRLAPVVYGFPSQALVRAQRSGHVVLGGDYLVATDPSWVCLGFCATQWRTWPWGRNPHVCDPGVGNGGLLQRLGVGAMARGGVGPPADDDDDASDAEADNRGPPDAALAAAAGSAAAVGSSGDGGAALDAAGEGSGGGGAAGASGQEQEAGAASDADGAGGTAVLPPSEPAEGGATGAAWWGDRVD